MLCYVEVDVYLHNSLEVEKLQVVLMIYYLTGVISVKFSLCYAAKETYGELTAAEEFFVSSSGLISGCGLVAFFFFKEAFFFALRTARV
jgi:hypothetical protein